MNGIAAPFASLVDDERRGVADLERFYEGTSESPLSLLRTLSYFSVIAFSKRSSMEVH
jgi:hypothetical protein